MVSASFLSSVALTLGAVLAQNNYYNYARQFPQQALDGFNALRFLGGLGPYIDRDSVGISRDPPSGCTVDQVFMLHRHGERFPTASSGSNTEAVVKRILDFNTGTWQGTLSFLNTWQNFLDEPSWFEQETWQGPYAGLTDAFSRGSAYSARYGQLWDQQSSVPIFASGSERVLETARMFGQGFFGYNYTSVVEMQIIPESSSQGANSLTPPCWASSSSPSMSYSSFPEFQTAADRINAEYSGLDLSASDVFHLMELTAYELNLKPMSPWVNVFTLEEWITFRYWNDVSYYYGDGVGNPNAKAIGSVWVKAVTELMNNGPSSSSGQFNSSSAIGSMYFTFAHDTQVVPVVAALGLALPSEDLPTDQVIFDPAFQSTQIVPMGGHVTLERLSCSSSHYIRAVINEAVVPWNNCSSGPGYSCPLSNFTDMVNALPSYTSQCQVPSKYPQSTTFFTNYNHSTQLDVQDGPLPYQVTDLTSDGQAT